jgi:hypothetical protein
MLMVIYITTPCRWYVIPFLENILPSFPRYKDRSSRFLQNSAEQQEVTPTIPHCNMTHKTTTLVFTTVIYSNLISVRF